MGKKLSLSFFILLFLACDSSLMMESFQKVNPEAWYYKELLSFDVAIHEAKHSSISLAIRNTAAYEKANLWLFVSLISPSGKEHRDTISCPLADGYGHWLGKGFSGLYLTEHNLKEHFFEEIGDWKINIEQGMRQDTIRGISEVGVIIRSVTN